MSILNIILTNTPSGPIAGPPATEASYFYRLIQQAAAIEPVPYVALVRHSWGASPKHKILGWLS